jgi:hypothetical protein
MCYTLPVKKQVRIVTSRIIGRLHVNRRTGTFWGQIFATKS